jgi:WD40 repeat protein
MGYRYNIEKGRVQKTGIIKITPQPRGATIFLNGTQYLTSLTPAKIEYQLPGDYEIKLTKDGYFDWQKKLPVFENVTTFAEKILLWKKSTPQQLASSSAMSWLTSPDGNLVIFTDQKKNIFLLDINSGLLGELTGGTIESIATGLSYDSISFLEYSPSGRYVLAQTSKKSQTGYLIIDTTGKTTLPLVNKKYKNVRWNTIGDELVALDASGVWQINLTSAKANLLTKLTAHDFYLEGKSLYYINNQTLVRENITGSNIEEIKKIDCQDCNIKTIKAGKALIIDPLKKLMTVVDLSGKIKNVQLAVNKSSWLDGDSVLLYSDFEIYIFDLAKPDPELITRLGTPITSAIWHPQARHLILSTEGKIKIMELDNRELRNILTIADSQANFMNTDRSGKNLFFSGTDKIYRLNLQ